MSIENQVESELREFVASEQEAGMNGHQEQNKPKKYELTDLGNAERLVDTFGRIIRYVPDWRTWMYFDGIRWKRVDDTFMNGLAKRVLRQMQIDANVFETDTDEVREKKAKIVHWVRICGYGMHTSLMVSQAKDAVLAHPNEFDQNPWLVVNEDVTHNLLTGETYPHRPEDRVTKVTGTALQAPSNGTRFLQFLSEVFNGDAETIEYVQKILGYALSGVVREQHLFMPFGSGRNGKTVLFEVIADVLGEYAAVGDTDLILDTGKFEKKNYSLANLVGVRFVTFAESNDGKHLNAARVKALTGGDRQLAEAKFQRPFEFAPQFKLFLYINHLPVVEEVGDALWERLRVIPFHACFIKGRSDCHEPDTSLIDALKQEKPFILRWLVDGNKKWQAEGLNEPASVREATKTYKEDSDILAEFLEERTIRNPNVKATTTELYDAYKDWYKGPFEDRLSDRAFGRQMSSHGFRSKRSHGVTTYYGIEVNLDAMTNQERRIRARLARDKELFGSAEDD